MYGNAKTSSVGVVFSVLFLQPFLTSISYLNDLRRNLAIKLQLHPRLSEVLTYPGGIA